MKVTMFSNYLNHLQTSFCDEMYKYLGTDFTFVSTEPLPPERLLSGYQDCSDYVYNLNSFESNENHEKAIMLGLESDIVITGAAPYIYIKKRVKAKKHTFRYSERFLKRGTWLLLSPRYLFQFINNHILLTNSNNYMLCTSAFTARDLSWIYAYRSRTYKWGYFTEVKEIDIDGIIEKKPSERIEIIWTARYLDWKHPELAVKLGYELKKRKYNFHLTMIGEGELKTVTQSMVNDLQLNDCISIIGSVSNEKVRDHMLNSNIFLFTSDRNEGWGVVLNEAMSSGCGILAADEIGSVPYLLENEVNGLVFKSGSLTSLLSQCEKLIHNKLLREELGKKAYQTMKNVWSPANAAQNFIKLAQGKLNNIEANIDFGPCSRA